MPRHAAGVPLGVIALLFLAGCAVLGSPPPPLPLPPPPPPKTATLLTMADEALAHGNVERAADLYGRFLEIPVDAEAVPRARAMRATLLRLLATEAEAAQLREAHEAVRHELAARERDLAARERDLQQLVAELNARQVQDRALRTALDSAQAELLTVRADRDRLQAEAERLHAERERLRADVERLRTIDLRDPRR